MCVCVGIFFFLSFFLLLAFVYFLVDGAQHKSHKRERRDEKEAEQESGSQQESCTSKLAS